jgi:hypothetical protein
MEKESTGERGMGIRYKGSQGQTKFPQRHIITEKILMTPNTDFIHVGHFLIQRIFQETPLQILSYSDGVMKFGTKIFIFADYLYSHSLGLHANCANTLLHVQENYAQNT